MVREHDRAQGCKARPQRQDRSPDFVMRLLAVAAPLFLAALATATMATAARAQGPAAPVAITSELKQGDRAATLTFTLSRPVETHVTVLERPDRLVIDLPEVNFQAKPGAIPAGRAGLVSSYRHGLFAPGRSRIVIDLRRPAVVAQMLSERGPGGQGVVLTVDLAQTDRETYAKAAKSAAASHQPTEPRVELKPGSKPVIVLDPGHGGVDPGAIGAGGVAEKTIVYAFAARLKERLDRGGRYHVVMTRDEDTFISLGDRVRVARKLQASLFVSIHADTLSASPDVRGATVYTGSERATDRESEALAQKENQADAVAGAETPEEMEEVANILTDLTRRETRMFSQQVAKQVVNEIRPVMRLNKNPHRSAGFRVLKAPDVASILVELGYLSSAQDIALLQSEAWRDRSTGAIAEAIDRYFSERTPIVGRASVSP